MNDLQKELQDLKAKVAELEARIVAEPVAKWQPKGGSFFIGNGGLVNMFDSRVFTKEFGMERETREQAQRAAKEMRRFNRLLALRDELCGAIEWDTDNAWDEDKAIFAVCFNHKKNTWDYTYTIYEHITPYFTTLESAQKACDMLNSGEVEL